MAGPVLSLRDKRQRAQKHRLEIFIEFVGKEAGAARKHQLYQMAVKGLKCIQNEVKKQELETFQLTAAFK